MRFIRRLLAGLNRRQQRRRNKLLTGKKSGYYDVFSDENGGGRKVCTTDETSSTEGSRVTTMPTTPSSSMPPSPWKAENFLQNGCIRETDWWKHETIVVAAESDNDDHDELDHTGTIQEYDGSSLTSGSATPTETPSHHSTNPKKIFVNQGLALWQQGRDAWKSARPAVIPDSPVSRRRNPSAIPETFKAELVKCLGDRRQFELSQRIPLQTIIEAYQQVWNEGSKKE